MQHADAKFERRDPWPQIPFAYDDADSLPSLPECIGWVVLAAMFVFLCLMLMGVA